MKKLNFTVTALLFIVSLLFVNCTPDMPYASTTKEVITQGKWSIDYYYAGQDKTAQYQNFQFNFLVSGTMTCTNGTDTYEGTWNIIKDVSRADVMTISINNQVQTTLAELNTSWTVMTVNLNYVAMKDVNSTQLIFKKL